MKFVGALIIILGGGAVGFLLSKNYLGRLRELKLFLMSLQMLETEIIYTATPLAEAFLKISQMGEKEVKSFFAKVAYNLEKSNGQTAFEAWQKSLKEYYVFSFLKKGDIFILKNLGKALGMSDRQDQTKHLGLAREQLKMEVQKAEEEACKNVKICNYMGFLGGIALVLLIY